MPDVEDELDDDEAQVPAVAIRPAAAYFPCPFFHV